MRPFVRRSLQVLGLVALAGTGLIVHPAYSEATVPSSTSAHTAPVGQASIADVTDFAQRMVAVGDDSPTLNEAAQNAARRALFTPSGWAGFQNARNAARIPQDVAGRGIATHQRATGPARIDGRSTNAQGQPVWHVSLPVVRTVRRSDATVVEQAAHLDLVVVQTAFTDGKPVLRTQTVILALDPSNA